MERTDLINHIKESYPKLSKGQKLLSDYIIENYDKAAFMTAGALGRAVGISESTVVRFTYALGYKGYPKLQKHLQEIIKNRLTTIQRLNIMDGIEPDKIMDNVLKTDISNLNATRASLDVNLFKRVAEIMISARRVYIVGFRSSAPLAQFLAFYLRYILDNITLVSTENSDVFTQLLHVGEEDVVMGMAYPRYSSQTIKGLRFAKSKGAQIVTMTDNELSPLYELADICLLTKNDINSFVDSYVAPLSLINALIIMIGAAKKETLTNNLHDLEELWQNNNIYGYDK
ncbi:MAG: MurR/RpiR family transcriptional regulator [Christensenellaceae bacterium]|nr:MurR/RpiR family transcriptional regulator [Christensenellaceae bacterium]